jgi:small-conductance mechanosensitive channel
MTRTSRYAPALVRTGRAVAAAMPCLIWAASARAQTEILTPVEAISQARERLVEIVSGSDGALARMGETLAATSPTGAASWHAGIALWSLGALIVGYGLARLVGIRVRDRLAYLFEPSPKNRFDRLSYLLIRVVMMLVSVGILVVVAGAIALGVNGDDRAARIAHALHIGGVGLVMALAVLSRNILAPDVPSHRFFALSDDLARSLHRGFVTAMAIATAIFFTCLWMDLLGLDRNVHFLLLVTGLAAIALVFVIAILTSREGLRALIAGPASDVELPAWRRFLAQNVHILSALYFAFALFVAEVRVLTGQPIPFSPILVPLLAPLAASLIYMVLLWLIDGVALRLSRRAVHKADPDILDGGEAPTTVGPGHARVYEGPSLKDVAERAATFLVLATVAYSLFRVWSLSPEALAKLWQFFDILAVAFIGYVVYQGIKVYVDRKIWEEGDSSEAPEPGDEGGAQSASRLATLLPLARNFLLITVAVMTVMIVASEFGVNIAPLFAGAGVVGLAVGFGAQTLIADIFSGAFFLIDDAFRKGDYVETNGIRGTVEKISVRSMQLRHHMGPLHTVPFSQITHLTNFSRDWAMMKLKLRLTYDTDVEKVRKLIKTLGKELQADPEIGEKFVQPLKSQGVYAMEDSAMIIRVKYMTRPGDQFVIRKRVYADIRRLFEENGIKFAHREVTVRLAPGEDAHTLSEERKEQIAGAVLPTLDEPQSQPSGDNR